MPASGGINVHMIGARTDSAGADPGGDIDQEMLRVMAAMLLRPGIWPYSVIDDTVNPNAWRVRQGAGSMQVTVGSTVSKADVIVLRGTVAGQGKYLLRLDSTGVTLTVPASDPALPVKYGVYVFIDDATYAGTASRRYAGMSVIKGTPNASPVVPGPLSTWSAYYLLHSFQLAAAFNAQVTNTILDQATSADGRLGSSVIGVNPLEIAALL